MVYLSWASGPRAEMIDDPLSILMLEDDAADQQLLERELRKHIRQLALTWVTGPQDYERALRTFPFDLILADYNVPGYHGLAALELARRIAPRTPFIVVTGSLDEETAADIVKAGAADYVLKERIARLGPAIGSARERQRMENEKETAVLALRESEERYALAMGGAHDGLFDWDLRRNRIHFSPRWKEMLGHAEADVGSAPEEWLGRIHPEEVGEFRQRLGAHLEGREAHFDLECRIRHRRGRVAGGGEGRGRREPGPAQRRPHQRRPGPAAQDPRPRALRHRQRGHRPGSRELRARPRRPP